MTAGLFVLESRRALARSTRREVVGRGACERMALVLVRLCQGTCACDKKVPGSAFRKEQRFLLRYCAGVLVYANEQRGMWGFIAQSIGRLCS